ncbi:MAG: PDZ domain-containing protein [Candidatus Eisenbacteria bacterium]|uniref:Tricorn protease homolog n=1 Tax=Eiseniibacteriota bacterium TaxID=2212470 RepID=A0A956ND34_UNCEI|nr:PDZ domain-containing protein [Candidatus Eisenbacteria bacterium]
MRFAPIPWPLACGLVAGIIVADVSALDVASAANEKAAMGAASAGVAAAHSDTTSSGQFLRRPDIHGDQLVFTSEGDLWLGSVQEGTAFRITSDEGYEGPAFFSPDGARLAFSAQYDGATDVYVMNVQGGSPERLTWAPSGVTVLGWTPDGAGIVFRSRWDGAKMRSRLFTVSASGGSPTELPVPYGEFASIAADGQIAYVPVSAEWQHWKRYRGGLADDIWLAEPSTGEFTRLTDDAGVDTEPVWVGNDLYMVSERDGLANLFQLDPASGAATAATQFTEYDVRYPNTDGTRIVFEHGDGIALYDPASGATRDLELDLRSDRIHARPRRVSALDELFGVDLGPTGKRLLVSSRGQILSAPAEKGDVRVVTAVDGVRCQYPAWSPDASTIAYVSDESGEEQIWLLTTTDEGVPTPKQLTKDHQGPLGPIAWSPDGSRLLTSDRELRILLVDAKTGAMKTVAQLDRGGSYDFTLDQYRFSPDGKWVAYSFLEPNWNWTVQLYEIATGKMTRVTSPEMSSYAPAFDAEGKYLYFLSDREYANTYSQGNRYYSFRDMTKVSLVTLSKETESPFLEKNDEEGAGDDSEDGENGKGKDKDEDKGKDDGKKKGKSGTPELPKMTVDVDGIAARVDEVPMPAARYTAVEPVEGKLLVESFLSRGADDDEDEGRGNRRLQSFDLEEKEAKDLVGRLEEFDLSFDRKKLLIRQGRNFTVMDATAGEMPKDDGAVDTQGWTLTVDPEAEWRQIFHESWRVVRDFFYAPNMHGVDWNAVRTKYEPMLGAVAVRSDLTFVLGEMMAELNCGHAYVGGGDQTRPRFTPLGYLGADFEAVPGATPAYRITKILPGDGFDLDARSPLLTPGVDVSVGDYILAVSGRPVRTDQDLRALLVGTGGRWITLTVNSKPSLEGARDVLVEPMSSERRARYFDWVESRREYVRTNGGENLGYVHIPDMSGRGLQEFAKHYYANLDRDGLVYDVRFNGGGWINAMLLLQMSSPQYSFFKPRHGASWSRQDWAFPGYGVALCNDQSGSNAEEFSDAFQRLGIGPLIGTRSWGGEVGSGGGYTLVDGGWIFPPNYAAWVPEGEWIIEGIGVRPDVEVEDDPSAYMQGRDPQLDAAIDYLKKRIAESPVPRPTPPPYPDKSKGGSDRW